MKGNGPYLVFKGRSSWHSCLGFTAGDFMVPIISSIAVARPGRCQRKSGPGRRPYASKGKVVSFLSPFIGRCKGSDLVADEAANTLVGP